MTRRWLLGFVLVAAWALAPGCGEDVCIGECPCDGGPDQVDAGQDAGGHDFDSLTVRVIYGHGPDNFTAAAGAMVALDIPGSERREQSTDGEGQVTFEAIGHATDPLSVTAHLPGLSLASRVGITPERPDVTLWLPTRHTYPDETVTISGTAQNRNAVFDELFVSTTQSDWFFDKNNADWSLGVRKDTPFTLIAMDGLGGQVPPRDYAFQQYAWVVVDHLGVSTDTTVDIDFASQAVTPKSAQGSFKVSSRPGSLMGGQGHGWINVCAEMGEAYLGLPTEITLSADGTRFDYTIQWIEPASVTRPRTVYILWEPWVDAQRSEFHVPGYPTAGPHAFEWIEAPIMTAPADPGTPHPLHQPLTWTRDNYGTDVRLLMERTDTPPHMHGAWQVFAPGDATTLTIPLPPSTVNVVDVLGTAPLNAYLSVMERDATQRLSRQGLSKMFKLAP